MSCYQCGDEAPLVYMSRCINCVIGAMQMNEKNNDDLRERNCILSEEVKQLRNQLAKNYSYKKPVVNSIGMLIEEHMQSHA
jgi:hypothetical protein